MWLCIFILMCICVFVHMCVSMLVWVWGPAKVCGFMYVHIFVGKFVWASISTAAYAIHAGLRLMKLMLHCCICHMDHTTTYAASDIQMHIPEMLLHVSACIVCTSEWVSFCISGYLNVFMSIGMFLHMYVHIHGWKYVQLFVYSY